MLLYAFQGRYGGDKICWTQQSSFAVGDLLIGSNDMYLVLHNSELKTQNSKLSNEKKNKVTEELTVDHKQFLRKETIELIHRMVHEYYTSYKNVVKLFVSGELADLFKKELSVKKKPFFNVELLAHDTHTIEKTIIDSKEGQQLIVFPDVRTMMNTMKSAHVEEKTGIVVLTSSSTQQQKDKAWRGIKMGHINTLICTSSEIFQDRKDLQKITLIDSHQWYYKSQQDPRYDTRSIVRYIANQHHIPLEVRGVDIFHS